MLYKVTISPVALADAADYVAYIRDQNLEPVAAARWYDGLTDAILSLDTTPRRCPVVPEQNSFKIELRHYIYHSHRIINHIDEEARVVHVLRVYHGARNVLRSDEVDLP